MGQVIVDYFKDGTEFGVNIDYFFETEPLGNAGALFRLREEINNSKDDSFLLLNADALFDVDFNRMVQAHRSKDALVTLFTHPNSHPYDSGIIMAGEGGQVDKWLTKEDARPEYYKNRVNAGLHIISASVIDDYMKVLPSENVVSVDNAGVKQDRTALVPVGKVDLDRMILKPLAGTGKMYAYDSPEYVKDMGTPERYYAVSKDWESGIVKEKNLLHKQKAIFLDRDGTINKYVGFLRDIAQFDLLPGVVDAIKKINSSGYLAIVVTNQPVIARGEVTAEELQNIHNKMETLLGLEGAYLDAIYFCPHHPHRGYEGEIPELKIDCECRKPKPGLLIKAAEEFNIDLSQSWMVGDSGNDIEAGVAAGCMTGYLKREDDEVIADVAGNTLDEIISKILTKDSTEENT